jgi:hypothetical protein
MSDIRFTPFDKQKSFLLDHSRIKGAFAGKRGGKTEVGAINAILLQENKPSYKPTSVDPFLGIIIAPTSDMLRRLSWKKFLAYAKPFIKRDIQSPKEITWHDDSMIYGISAEKPQRLEGVKANWIWIDEVFQVKEQIFLEALARVSDQKGFVFCTGSLGIQYVNPKTHWAFERFKTNPKPGTTCYEWSTSENPYFPKDELEDMKSTLDIRTFNQMFKIDWDVTPEHAVYSDFSEINEISHHSYDSSLETFVSIDWGWAHPMACLFFQYDRKNDTVYLFDEIVSSKMTLEQLWERIKAKNYSIKGWCCDIAGNQEREQTGKSNIKWFRDNCKIELKYRATAITYGIAIVRSYIKTCIGSTKFFVSKFGAPKTLDALKNYRYHAKDGIIQNENPIKENDDPVDAMRYFFVNFLDKNFRREIQVSQYA